MTSIFDTPLYAYARHADQENKAPRRHPVVICLLYTSPSPRDS